jgi:hypothetical protein
MKVRAFHLGHAPREDRSVDATYAHAHERRDIGLPPPLSSLRTDIRATHIMWMRMGPKMFPVRM